LAVSLANHNVAVHAANTIANVANGAEHKGVGRMDAYVRDALKALMQRNKGDELLDKPTLELCKAVYKRARRGATVAELTGYVAYRKRVAQGEDKTRAQRVLKAIKTNRWGIADDIAQLQEIAADERAARRERQQIRETWFMQISEANARIPENKRGKGRKSGRSRSRKDKFNRRAMYSVRMSD